jgi:Tol biopolymer transport system component
MDDLRSEIRAAFETEQAAYPPAGSLRPVVVRMVATTPLREPRFQWLAVAAAALLTAAIVVGMLAVRYGNFTRPGHSGAAPPPQLCVAGPASSTDRFVRVHGCITYTDGRDLWAVDPFHPANKISLGPAAGLSPIAWSADGQRLLLQGRYDSSGVFNVDLFVMNPDGSRTQLTHSGGALFGGSFSPDGETVVYADTDGLFVVNVHGGSPRALAANELEPWRGKEFPAWSPDGSQIAYVVDYEGATEIWTMNSDGSGQRRLVALGACEGGGCTPGLTWSPDGSQLAFASSRYIKPPVDLEPVKIYTVRSDGSQLRQITHGLIGDLKPAWSQDGSRIAFVRGSSSASLGQLFTVAQDGTDLRPVSDALVVEAYGAGIAWNPVAN